MDDFENIKQLWNSKNTLDTPNLEQIQTVIKKYQNKKKRNAFLLVATFVSCGVVLTVIIIFHNPTLWTTTLGKILMLLGFISGLILKLITLKRITKNELKSNKDFLENLIKVTNQKKTKVNWLQIFSTLLLAIGYGFYIYEEIKDNQTKLILSYFGICLFALGMYFIFRPYIKRKSKNKNKKILEVIKELS